MSHATSVDALQAPAVGLLHVLTVDLEDWFHGLPAMWSGAYVIESRVERCTYRLLDLLDRCDARATFFALGEVIESSPELAREVVRRGHELGTHGMRHDRVGELGPARFRRELRQSIDLLEDAGGRSVVAYRAPFFSLSRDTGWALDVLVEEGIRIDSSLFPIWIPSRGEPRACRLPHEIKPGLLEWPMTALPTPIGGWPFSGGSYLRVLPLAVVLWAMRRIEARGEPLTVYVHPYELDPDPPRVPLRMRVQMAPRFARLAVAQERLTWVLSRAKHVGVEEAAGKLARVDGLSSVAP